MNSLSLEKAVNQLDLIQLNNEVSLQGRELVDPNVNRPALQLTGFFEYFDPNRLQVLGKVEQTYLENLDSETRTLRFRQLFEKNIVCLVLCHGMKPFDEMLPLANQYNIPIFSTEEPTSAFMGEVIHALRIEHAQRTTLHGGLVDIYGEGVLIIGESGVGKSETALELVKRGHRLVADDAVEIRKVTNKMLIGSSPEMIRHFIEIRGIGIVDVSKMFGVQSVKKSQVIDMVIKLENWDPNKEYERVGLGAHYYDILGAKFHCYEIPIRPGRNLSIICESAAVNHRQRKMGYNAARALSQRVMKGINGHL